MTDLVFLAVPAVRESRWVSHGGFRGIFCLAVEDTLAMDHALCNDCPAADSGRHRFTYKPRSEAWTGMRGQKPREGHRCRLLLQASWHRLQKGCWPREKPESRGNHAHPVVTQGNRTTHCGEGYEQLTALTQLKEDRDSHGRFCRRGASESQERAISHFYIIVGSWHKTQEVEKWSMKP